MRDTRRNREILVIGLTAAIGAILAERLVRPTLERRIKK
jgi:hypothetical protein